jgi:photosystem II stability/assembly factor-like uncharacterized protein
MRFRFLAVLLLALAPAARALPPAWAPLGPFGGFVQALTADPRQSGTVYATTPSGIFKTVDGGASWTAISLEQPTSAVAVDPSHPSTLYVGIYGGALLLKSTDGGATWAPSGRGLIPPQYRSGPGIVAIDPARPSRLLLTFASVLYRSTDAGASWQPVNGALPSAPVTVAFAARPAGTAFTTTFAGDLYRTPDAGLSWKKLTRGLPARPAIDLLALAPSDPETLYAYAAGSGLYRSANGGDSWSQVSGPSDLFNGGLFVSPGSPRTLYAGPFNSPLYRSTDGGAHWAALSGVMDVASLAFDAAAPRRIYAGSTVPPLAGVWRSDDDGASWTRRSQGMTGLAAPLLAADPQAPDRLWTTVGAALFRSDNGGTRWARARSASDSFLSALAVGASSDLFAGVPFQIPRGPVEYSTFKTPDGGASWKLVLDYLHVDVLQIVAAPSDLATIYLKGLHPGGAIQEIYRSTDNGETWEQRAAFDPASNCGLEDLAVAPSSAMVLYLATGRFNAATSGCERSVIRSGDGGATWTAADAGLPDLGVVPLAVDPADPGRVYAGTAGDGVWKSADGGQSWSRAGLAGQSVFVLLAAAPDRVYAVAGNRVFRSDDGGATWQARSRGLRVQGISALVADPGDPRRIYAATTNGVWALTETD